MTTMRQKIARAGVIAKIGAIALMVLGALALMAPLLANGRPLLWRDETGITFPFLRTFFASDAPEAKVDEFFNYLFLLTLCGAALSFCRRWKKTILLICAIAVAIPFFTTARRVDKRDWRQLAETTGNFAVFAPIPYGPFEPADRPYLKPSRKHLCGTDEIGRDVASRLIYGARVSLAVGILSTLLALLIGTPIGLLCGYFGGKLDLFTMRIVEMLLCFPTFLLLLILMSLGADAHMEESVPLLVGIIALTGWIGFATLVRGEALRLRTAPFIESCRVSGVPVYRILLTQLLPNVAAVLVIAYPFAVAGAILAESSLSFLGFGVRPPTASWGNLLRQAFDNPLEYWHLTLFPGIALFLTVIGFNFTGEGLRKILDVKA